MHAQCMQTTKLLDYITRNKATVRGVRYYFSTVYLNNRSLVLSLDGVDSGVDWWSLLGKDFFHKNQSCCQWL